MFAVIMEPIFFDNCLSLSRSLMTLANILWIPFVASAKNSFWLSLFSSLSNLLKINKIKKNIKIKSKNKKKNLKKK